MPVLLRQMHDSRDNMLCMMVARLSAVPHPCCSPSRHIDKRQLSSLCMKSVVKGSAPKLPHHPRKADASGFHQSQIDHLHIRTIASTEFSIHILYTIIDFQCLSRMWCKSLMMNRDIDDIDIARLDQLIICLWTSVMAGAGVPW